MNNRYTCSLSVLMPVAKKFLLQHNILASEKNNTDDYLINPESVVCGIGKLELEDK